MTLFKSPFVNSDLNEWENNALRSSSLMVVPPPPPEVHPLEGLQGINLPKANLTQWASCIQDIASRMRGLPRVAIECPTQDMTGVLHKLEKLIEVSFCWLCYALGSNCRCPRAPPQVPHSQGTQALWAPPQPSYASMASATNTTASTSPRGVSSTIGPPPGFPAMEAPSPMDVSPASKSYNPLTHAGVSRGLPPQSASSSAMPRTPGIIGLCQLRPSAL